MGAQARLGDPACGTASPGCSLAAEGELENFWGIRSVSSTQVVWRPLVPGTRSPLEGQTEGQTELGLKPLGQVGL